MCVDELKIFIEPIESLMSVCEIGYEKCFKFINFFLY